MSEKPATEEEYEQVYEHEHDDEPIETKRIPSHVTEDNNETTYRKKKEVQRLGQGSVKKGRYVTPPRMSANAGGSNTSMRSGTLLKLGVTSSVTAVNSKTSFISKFQTAPLQEKFYEKKMSALLEENDVGVMSNKQLSEQTVALRAQLRELNFELTQKLEARKILIQKQTAIEQQQQQQQKQLLLHQQKKSRSMTSREEQLRSIQAEIENARKEQRRLQLELQKLREKTERYKQPQFYFEVVEAIEKIKIELDNEQKINKTQKAQTFLRSKDLATATGASSGSSSTTGAEKVVPERVQKIHDLESEVFNVSKKNSVHRDRLAEIDKELSTLAQKTEPINQKLITLQIRAQENGIETGGELSRMGLEECAPKFKTAKARYDNAKKHVESVAHVNNTKCQLLGRQNEKLQREITRLDEAINQTDLEILQLKQKISTDQQGLVTARAPELSQETASQATQ